MVQVTMFGGHDGRLRYDKWLYITMFGGVELVRPTVARQILADRQNSSEQGSRKRKPFFFTAFGGADIKAPTLAEEFIDLQEMLRSGALTAAEWERALSDLGRDETGVGSFTIFGGFDERAIPSEDEEVDSLAVQRHLGNIPEPAAQVLQYGIGQHGSERTATLRRALSATG